MFAIVDGRLEIIIRVGRENDVVGGRLNIFSLLVEMAFRCSKGGWKIFFNICCRKTWECDEKIVIDGA